MVLRVSCFLVLIISLLSSACFNMPEQQPVESPTSAPAPAAPPVQQTGTPATTVPEEYRHIYRELDSALTQFEKTLSQKKTGNQGKTTFATELAFANGNIGEALLLPQVFRYNQLLLSCLEELGIKGVALSIQYPLLQTDFPRSSEYLRFYKAIADECRLHGMKVIVETGAIFSGTPYSPVKVDWSKYTSESLLEGMQDQLILIAKEIKPDYLTLMEEPTTQEALTGLQITPGLWNSSVISVLNNIGRPSGIQIGAGMGSWESHTYIDAFLRMPRIDYIDLHIYPLGREGVLFERALDIAREAHESGKAVTIGECWLFKTLPEEMIYGPDIGGKIFSRDPFSFWYPLDARFIDDIIDLADAADIEFVSFFWTRYFFSYLDYSAETRSLSTSEINRRINQAANINVREGILSPLGKYYQKRLSNRTPAN